MPIKKKKTSAAGKRSPSPSPGKSRTTRNSKKHSTRNAVAAKKGGKAGSKTAGKSAAKTSGRAAAKTSGKSGVKPGGKAAAKPGGKSGAKVGRKIANRSRGKPTGPAPKRRRSTTSKPPTGDIDGRPPRLQKVLAAAGIGSRRACEEYILEGRVEIDGNVVTELGVRVDPQTQTIRLDGDIVQAERLLYYAVNKPPGVLSTNRDPAGRMRVVDLVPANSRVFTVGRLDKASEGLMLVTNDGELANRLAHPRYQVEKTYIVTVAGQPTQESLNQLRRGVRLAEGTVKVQQLRVKRRLKQSTVIEMVLTEGRNREIRRMAARLGHKVITLKRVGIGPLRVARLPVGAYRPLSRQEVVKLKALVSRRKR